MIRLIWTVSVHTRYFLRRYMPTNILLDAIRTRRGLKWGVPAIPYLLIANVCVRLIEDDAPGWLHLVVLWAIWNMLKMIWIGPISVVLLVRARIRESVAACRDRQLDCQSQRCRRACPRGRGRYPVTCVDSGADPATAASTERATARNHRRADGLVADS